MAEALPATGRWREVASAPATWLPPRTATLTVATVLPAMVQVHWLGLPWTTTCVVGACLAVIAIVGPERLVVSVAAALVVGVVVSPKIGPIAAVVVMALAVGWLVVEGRVWRPDVARSIPPMALGPMAVASVLLSLRAGLVLPAALIVLGFGLTAIERLAPAGAGRFVRVVDGAAAHVARWVAVVAMLPVAVVIVVVWLGQQVVRFDPLRTPPGWSIPTSTVVHPDRLFGTDGRRVHGLRRLQRATGSLLSLGLVVVAVGLVTINPQQPPVSPVFADEPHYEQVWQETSGFIRHPEFDPVSGYRMGDYESEFVNQVDGKRKTWTPPTCDCPRYTVWWFGGSAAWGFYQEDLESLPSQLAKKAWESGIALDIQNWAVPGYTLSQEAQRFAWLSANEPAPDLAIFYDGANELDFQATRNDRGRGDDESPVMFQENLLEGFFNVFQTMQSFTPQATLGRPLDGPATTGGLDAPILAEHTMARYNRGVDLVRRIGDSIGARVAFAWQPTQSTADGAYRAFEGAPPWRPQDLDWWQRYASTARQALPGDAIDLADAIDDPPAPVMPDWSHTNTAGAKMIAAELFAELRPTLDQQP